ncbi:MAG: signal peptide protein [Tardiphaga sp.]|jgi:hypothetical protein|nr:signal peptide protein [Tardiphaga sp.]
MNGPAALIAGGIGAAFFAAASLFYYQPAFINPDYALDHILTTNQSKARAAVIRLLLNPGSARFDAMRSVQVDGAKFVCGQVDAKDASGAYAGNKAFVYTAAIDFARIDDDGQIAQRHSGFKSCPLSVEEEIAQKKKMLISSDAIALAKKIQKAMPTTDESVLTTLSLQMSAGETPSGGSGQALRPSVGAPAASGAPGGSGAAPPGSTFTTTDAETGWRADRPPAAWPVYAADHALAKPTEKRLPADAIALATSVETRWGQFKAGDIKRRPSADEIQQALRALLAIAPTHEAYPQAWATFVRLRKIEREALA